MITGHDRSEDLAAVLDAGANDYVAKPFDVGLLEVRLTIAERQVVEVAQRKRAEAALEHQALHDALTDLPNRLLLNDRLEHAIALARREQTPVALLMLDLDRFKDVNDTFGHMVGDHLLQEVARRMRDTLRASDTGARLGGDEFAVMLPNTDEGGACEAARKFLTALDEAVVVDDRHLDVRASIGIAMFPDHGDDAQSLLRQADIAMYSAKRAGGGLSVYTSGEDIHSPSRYALVGELRRAIDRGELELHYQPKVNYGCQCIVRVEALVRWQHPRQGLMLPDEFIPLAERTGLIEPLSRWVLNAALRQCHLWSQVGLALPVAVNLSMRDLHDPSLPDHIASLLKRWELDSSYLVVEITESAIMADPNQALSVLGRLSSMGVKIAIDDFGMGYSSLGYLTRLPVNQIKIDKSFVTNMLQRENDLAIVRSTIELGHQLGLPVLAEGVEDRATWELLATLGADGAQGYFFTHPLPPTDLLRWITTSTWTVGNEDSSMGSSSPPAA